MLTACQQVHTTQGGVVGVNRKQTMWISAKETDQMALAAYQDTLGKARGNGQLNRNPAVTERVRRIAWRLIAQTGTFRGDAVQWPWEINVQTSPEINAYCMSGGKIMVYTGLLETLKLTDDELAAVLGHEIAHALREHSRERISQAYGEQLLLGVGAAVLKVDRTQVDVVDKLFTVAYALPFSRKHETEADLMGIELAARAGFDPRAAVSLWQKMSKIGGGKPLEILSTHPSDNARIKNLVDTLPKVMPLYERAIKTGGVR